MSTNGECFIASSKKDNKKYFLKKIIDQTYGQETDPPELRKQYKRQADEWLRYHRAIRQELLKLGNGTGNIVFPVEFFVDDGQIYECSHYIEIKKLTVEQISKLTPDEKIKIIQTSTFALAQIHSLGIIHFDLKTDNIPISVSEMGGYISKITDCSDALFNTFSDPEKCPPQEQIMCTIPYWSPELALYKTGQENAASILSDKSDVFAMGLIIHEWWSGDFPDYEGKEDLECFWQYVNDIWPKGVRIDPSMPKWLSSLVTDMLCPNPDGRPTMQKVFESVRDRSYNKKGAPAALDFSPVKDALAKLPSNLSEYTDESAGEVKKIKKHVVDNKSNLKTQSQINELADKINSVISSLKKKNSVSFANIDKALSALSKKNLSLYTAESVDKLKKIIDIAENQRDLIKDSDTAERVYRSLVKAFNTLEPRNDFSLIPVSPVPKPYKKVVVVSDSEVIAYFGESGKIKLSAENAIKMHLVTRK